LFIAKAFERRDISSSHDRYRCYAGSNRDTIEEYGTGTTLRQTTAELRAVQSKVVAENFKQQRVFLNIDVDGLSIEIELAAHALFN